jgi:hypothetical protein
VIIAKINENILKMQRHYNNINISMGDWSSVMTIKGLMFNV